MNYMEKITKLITITALAFTFAACSSGGTESQSTLNVTGPWVAEGVSFAEGGGTKPFTVNLQFSQNENFAAGNDEVEIDVIATLITTNSAGPCGFSLTVEGGKLNRIASTVVLTEGEDFSLNAQIQNGTISGRVSVTSEDIGCFAVGNFVARRA